ncbi:MAG: DNA repair protein RecN [Alphaproteobacteria bacterium]
MLVSLSIRDIVVIDRLSVDFVNGMTVLTGETGAGKSILLDALSLALGGRGDASLVRAGAEQGDVAAVFDPAADHPVQVLLAERGLSDGGAVILRRVQSADGRSRAFINDEPVSVGFLRQIGGALVEIHGQHDDRAMVDGGAHRDLLDAYGGLGELAGDTAAAHAAFQAAQGALAALQAEVEKARAEAEYLRASVEELTTLDPQVDEETHLADTRQRMMRRERSAADLAEAHEAVAGNNSPIPTLSSLIRRLERKAGEGDDLFDGPVAALDAALRALQEAETVLEAAMRSVATEPDELERSEERLFALRAAGRKYAVPVSELAALTQRLRDELGVLDSGETRLGTLQEAVAEAQSAYNSCAASLSRRRVSAGKALARAVMGELPDLKLERATFAVDIAADATRMSEAGYDTVGFLVQTNPGTLPGPLMRVASGGELARFLLALKVALADKGSAPTLVFDEVDTAVGGAVADAIGVRLVRLAGNVQVMAVTHAPQVAARAGSHLLVSKRATKRGRAVATDVVPLAEEARREEIARMLAGATVTDEARAAADRLIRGAA